jgi:sugar phosphate isomerase/epimerase
LKGLVEAAGREFVGVCLDSGNPLWTLEDPHATLDVLHPYVLTSHVRDSAVWRVPQGVAVSWVVMGQGNVGIDSYVRRFAELCPGKALSMETIVYGPRVFPLRDRKFWEAYPEVKAAGYEQFLELADTGTPSPQQPWETKHEAERQRLALEASLVYTRKVLEKDGALLS